jgi:hypothetical protein
MTIESDRKELKRLIPNRKERHAIQNPILDNPELYEIQDEIGKAATQQAFYAICLLNTSNKDDKDELTQQYLLSTNELLKLNQSVIKLLDALYDETSADNPKKSVMIQLLRLKHLAKCDQQLQNIASVKKHRPVDFEPAISQVQLQEKEDAYSTETAKLKEQLPVPVKSSSSLFSHLPFFKGRKHTVSPKTDKEAEPLLQKDQGSDTHSKFGDEQNFTL